MKVEQKNLKLSDQVIFKKCHVCGYLSESSTEPKKCAGCNKAFLPANYFSKIHTKIQADFEQLFAHGHELREADIIKGLTVLW